MWVRKPHTISADKMGDNLHLEVKNEIFAGQ